MPVLYTLTVFVAAFLLFFVQPMIAKMILPKFGGAPAVWNTCMVFFQAALLGGYGYAHGLANRLSPRRQLVVHLGVMLLPLVSLPIAVAVEWEPPREAAPVPWLLWLLAWTAGLPFFVVAASAPLLQKWFAATGHPAGRDPYFLYAASNAGSILALLCYPALIEPYWTLHAQGRLWTIGYGVLLVLIGACALGVWRAQHLAPAADTAKKRGRHKEKSPGGDPGQASSPARQRARWIVLSFVPSSLLLAVTAYLSADVSPIPLMWVIPLALYLLTFVLAFAALPPLVHRLMAWTLPLVVVLQSFLMLTNMTKEIGILVRMHLVTFFVASMVCHGELARSRPGTERLTEFYLCLSIGGVLGGVFNALLAPLLFSTTAEYPLALVLACLLLPPVLPSTYSSPTVWLDVLLPLLVGVLAAELLYLWPSVDPVLRFGIPLLFCLALLRPLRFGLGLGAVFLVSAYYGDFQGRVVHRERNFFGVLRVAQARPEPAYTLYHGNIQHGLQHQGSESRTPLLYFYPTGPIGQVFEAFSGAAAKRRVAVIGLGIGALASYAEPGQEFTFYEIDPAVERLAENEHYFTHLRDCRGSYRVVLGDARLSLKHDTSVFDMIVVDAFSGDAIPIHLLTREALRLYFERLADNGLVVVHISNSHLDLARVMAGLARDAGLVAVEQLEGYLDVKLEEFRRGKQISHWVVLARTQKDLGKLAADPRWQPLTAQADDPVWTDDYSNLLGIMRWKMATYFAVRRPANEMGAK